MLKNNKGFSLIELMIVVVIIGILAAVAIPSYQGFQDKAKFTEAKTLLSGIYLAEITYFLEWENYSTDLKHIGIVAPPTGAKFYTKLGFKTAFAGTLGSGTTSNNFIGTAAPAGVTGTTCTATDSAFQACAEWETGKQWSINKGRVLAQY